MSNQSTLRINADSALSHASAPDLQAFETPSRYSRFIGALQSMPISVKISSALLAVFVLIALLAPLVAPHDPLFQDLLARLSRPGHESMAGESYLLGTDHLGRDILSRIIHGARISLGIAMFGTVFGLIIGTSVGLLAGLRRGVTEQVSMFLVDVQQALPFIIIALTVIAIYGSSIWVLLLVIGFAGWDGYARYTRGMALSVSQSQYVMASRAMGASEVRIMFRHILPNVTAPLIVLATLNITSIILLESTLSFLAIGVQPPTPSWGSMVGEGRAYINTAWWFPVFPGLAIVLVTMSVNLVGDWLRDILDPTMKRR